MNKRSINELERVLRRIKVHLTSIYGGMIKRVVVYGSFAKDEADEESDVDIAVVVADKANLGKAEKSRDELLSQILMEKSELVTVFVIPKANSIHISPHLYRI